MECHYLLCFTKVVEFNNRIEPDVVWERNAKVKNWVCEAKN